MGYFLINISSIANCNNNLAELYLSSKNYSQALAYASEALTIAVEENSMEYKQDAYKNLSAIYDSLGNYKKALQYHILYSATTDSLLNKESQRKIIDLESKYETEKKEKEIIDQKAKIEILEKGKEIELYRLWGLIIFILVIALISLFVVHNLRKRILLNKQLYEQKMKHYETQKLLTEAELYNKELESEQLQNELKFKEKELGYKNKELEYKNQELINFALHIAEKNDFIEELKAELSKSENKIRPSKLIKIIETNQNCIEKEKKEFEANVENISQGFFMKLRELIPDITKAEERLSALLRLNLSSKELSLVLNISIKSIEMSRYRLRKRLNLSKDDNLHDFLNNL